MLWRPFCLPFCLHETDMSEINFIMLNRFLDLKNLYVATKIMSLAQILKKILRILSFGGHLGRHLEYFNFPNDAKVASFSFNVRTYWRTHLCKNILCGLFFWVAPKIFIWQPDYKCKLWTELSQEKIQYDWKPLIVKGSKRYIIYLLVGFTFDSRYLEIKGTLLNNSRYPYFDISGL